MNNQEILARCIELAKLKKEKEEKMLKEDSSNMLKWCFGGKLSFVDCICPTEYKIKGTEYHLKYNIGHFILFLTCPYVSFNNIKIINWETLGAALLEAENLKHKRLA